MNVRRPGRSAGRAACDAPFCGLCQAIGCHLRAPGTLRRCPRTRRPSSSRHGPAGPGSPRGGRCARPAGSRRLHAADGRRRRRGGDRRRPVATTPCRRLALLSCGALRPLYEPEGRVPPPHVDTAAVEEAGSDRPSSTQTASRRCLAERRRRSHLPREDSGGPERAWRRAPRRRRRGPPRRLLGGPACDGRLSRTLPGRRAAQTRSQAASAPAGRHRWAAGRERRRTAAPAGPESSRIAGARKPVPPLRRGRELRRASRPRLAPPARRC